VGERGGLDTVGRVMASMTDSKLQDDLFAIEEGFWLEAGDYFLAHVDAHCLIAFPTMPDFHGVHSREEVAATATPDNRWRDLKMSSRQLIQPGSDVAIISYRVDVTRPDGKPYPALVSSAYARRDDGWKLAFHQHSPIEQG
jgi:hypothetical protein